MSKFRFSLAFLLLFGQFSTFAQITSEEEKIKEKERQEIVFLENIVNDAKNLRFPKIVPSFMQRLATQFGKPMKKSPANYLIVRSTN